MKEYIIYKGESFTIEWYFNESGKSEAKAYFDELDEAQQIKFLGLVKLFGDRGKIFNKGKFNNEGDKIYAFKSKPDRFLCFFQKGKKVIVTNAFHKKQQKLPKGEKEKALKRMDDYMSRYAKGDYYD
ncbi:MAG: type II toxin-antitoxin system RelE/ParE family toxin [Pseudomonadales bacterium]